MRVFNFSAGPSMLPQSVIEVIQEELLDWQGSGMSVMEVSHRGSAFSELAIKTKQCLKRLLNLPDDYEVLFLAGGATGQAAAVPMNLRHRGLKADYIKTGQWGAKAIHEARRHLKQVNIVSDTAAELRVPQPSELNLNSDAAYVHYTPNETILGMEFNYVPETGEIPLVGDFSSSILSRPINVAKHGVIYAGMQKNLGIAGLTLVIVHESLCQQTDENIPVVLDWKQQAANDSMLNTPATFTWYVAHKVLDWIEKQGGLVAMESINAVKAEKLYGYIDQSAFYSNGVAPDARSRMNVCFLLKDEALNAPFLAEAHAAGLTNLKGHRAFGGMRASIYNAMPLKGVEQLIQFMDDFVRKYT